MVLTTHYLIIIELSDCKWLSRHKEEFIVRPAGRYFILFHVPLTISYLNDVKVNKWLIPLLYLDKSILVETQVSEVCILRTKTGRGVEAYLDFGAVCKC